MTDNSFQHPGVEVCSMTEILRTEYPDPKWIVDGLIPEGLTILAGKPKLGKSWLALDICSSIALGSCVLGDMSVGSGTALYLALEDNRSRLKKRQTKMLKRTNTIPGFYTATRWPRLDNGGIDALKKWMEHHPDTRLIIIDTWEKVRQARRARANIYAEDYAHAGELKALADYYGIAVVVVHHVKKGKEDDIIDEISGSTGLAAAADTLLILTRSRCDADGALHVTGRDVEEREYALTFDKEHCTWLVIGDAEDFRRTEEERAVINLLTKTGPLPYQDVATSLKITKENAKVRLGRMVTRMLVERGDISGVYQLPIPPVTIVTA